MLPEMRHAKRREKQRVAVLGHRDRFVVAATIAHPVEGEIKLVGAESSAEPDPAQRPFLAANEGSCLEPVGVDPAEVGFHRVVSRLELGKRVFEVPGDVLK